MQVFDVTARYRRVVQPRDYESAEGELIFKATVEHGDNFAEVSAELLGRAKLQVNYALGIGSPTVAEEATVTEGPAETSAPEPAEDDAPKPKPRGRKPRGKAAPKSNSAEVPTEAPAIPGMDMDKLGAAAGPEAAETGLGPEFDETDEGGEEAEPEVGPVDVEILNENLQAEASKAAKKYGSKAVKDLMAKTFRVAKLGDLAQDKRRLFLNALNALK